MRTLDSVISGLTDMVKNQKPIPPETWLQASAYLTILAFPESLKMAQLESNLAQMKKDLMQAGNTAVGAETSLKTTQEWVDYKGLDAKLKMVKDLSMIAKKYASISVELGA